MVFDLLTHILKLRDQLIRDQEKEERLISDLLGAWNVVCRALHSRRSLPQAGSPPFDWSYLPTVTSNDLYALFKSRGVEGAYAVLAPSLDLRYLSAMPLIAATTFSVLTDPQMKSSTLHDASPLVTVLARLVAAPFSDMPGTSLSQPESVPRLVSEHIKREWPMMKQRATDMCGGTMGLSSTDRLSKIQSSRLHMDFTFIKKRLHDSMLRRDGRQVDELWAEVRQWPTSRVSDPRNLKFDRRRGILSPELCNYFVLVYMGLRRPNQAIDVWNHMVEKDISPGLTTWDAMMSGCKTTRDWKASEEVWRRMHSLGVQPDVVCWTTRITVLIESHKIENGVRALDEMGRLWLEAAKKRHGNIKADELLRVDDVDGAVKPTIVTINAVVAGLLRRQQREAVHRVLSWASNFGINPNVETYNTLLRSLVREGNFKGMINLLQQMEQVGLQPDVATFTTILDEAFRRGHTQTPDEQMAIVESVFHEMEASGIKANLYTYARIIQGVLQSAEPLMEMIDSILNRMSKQGLQPSPHINTMLVTHHFSQQPADLDAVRVLLDRIGQEVGTVDHIFWDRVIEGYARAGDSASAVRIFGKVYSEHNKVHWLTLGELITSLVINEDWDVAKSVVRHVLLDTGGPLSKDSHGEEGQHKFWDLARELKLLE